MSLPDDLITSAPVDVVARISSHPPEPLGRAQVAPRARAISGHEHVALDAGWELAELPPYAAATADDLARLIASDAPPVFAPAIVPGTVAMARAAGEPLLLGPVAESFDASDYVYRVRFDAPPGVSAAEGDRVLLYFGGLATLAEAWLNGQRLFSSGSMFVSTGWDVTDLLHAQGNELLVFFRALLPVLRKKQQRGRWPTPIVTEKHLRFVRTTLLGYTPGYCPSVRPVGPYGGVELHVQRGIAVERVRMEARLRRGTAQGEPPDGTLSIALSGSVLAARSQHSARETPVPGASLGANARSGLASAQLIVEGHGQSARVELSCTQAGESFSISGAIKLAKVEAWWPHTHGTPALYDARIELRLAGMPEPVRVELGRVGFRSIERSAQGRGDFGLIVNGERVFCRGASWTPLDLRALHASPGDYARALEQVRAAGMNMLRVPGTMTYESDAFYALCDELGILVWQDLMFANLDYPSDEPAFADLCKREASELLARLCARPSLAVLCGGSELEQQAAMMGMPPEVFHHPLVHDVLRSLCARERSDVPYVSNSPSEGALPFSVSEGPAHYYGVGAYLRPLLDAKASRVRFASECLAFAQPPERATLEAWLGADALEPSQAQSFDARYRAGVPRDAGSSWDFADVTEHYVHELFGSDPRALAKTDPARYLAESRAACVEIMQRAIGILRAREQGCRGLLVWFLRDLHLGAGWGVIDQRGAPKAAYYALKRAFAPIAAWLVNDGLDGISLHVDNESAVSVRGRVECALHRADGARVAHGALELELPARSEQVLRVDAIIGSFVDSSYAFRFGPAAHTLVAASFSFTNAEGREEVRSDCILPEGSSAFRAPHEAPGLRAEAQRAQGAIELVIDTQRFAPFVAIEAEGFQPSDNYFHLAPGGSARVTLTPRAGERAGEHARISALGATETLEVPLP